MLTIVGLVSAAGSLWIGTRIADISIWSMNFALMFALALGIDYALFSGDEGRRIKLMPCVTADRRVVFVEGDTIAWDGSGALASVLLRRNLHSYRPIDGAPDGLYHSPAALPDGRILVSRRPTDGSGDHGVYRLDPANGRLELVFDDPDYHDIQAKMLYARPEPDGRSSVVRDEDPNARLFCLDVRVSDLERRRLAILEIPAPYRRQAVTASGKDRPILL